MKRCTDKSCACKRGPEPPFVYFDRKSIVRWYFVCVALIVAGCILWWAFASGHIKMGVHW